MNRMIAAAALGLTVLVSGAALGQTQPPTPAPVRPTTRPATQPVRKDVGVEEFDKLRKDAKFVVLDVRTEREFAGGHIPGAVNIDVNAPDFALKAKELAKDKTLLVHCAAGRRSVAACDKLQAAGLKESTYNLEGGLRAWTAAGKPVEK
jgi:phage shock protein E